MSVCSFVLHINSLISRLQFAHEESLLPTASLALDASQYFRTQVSLDYDCNPLKSAGHAKRYRWDNLLQQSLRQVKKR